VLGYVSIVVILFSLIYFAVAFLWEVKMSQKKKKTKRQVMWSKLRGMKHVVVEDSRQQAKKSMLQSIMEKNKTKKVQPFNLKKLTTIVPSANSLALADNAPTTFENNASVVEDEESASLSSGESLMDFVSSSSAQEASSNSEPSDFTTSSSDRGSSGTLSTSSESVLQASESDSQIMYEETSASSVYSADSFGEVNYENQDGMSIKSSATSSGSELSLQSSDGVQEGTSDEEQANEAGELEIVDSD